MSDPAKTPEEIEDVLASVRRLVSDHAPTREPAIGAPVAEDAPAPEPAPMPAEALVLTPSFRVTDPEDPWVPVPTSDEVEDPSEDTPDPEDLVAELLTADDDAPVTEEADATTQADWQPDDRLASFDAVGEAEAGTPEEWVDDHSETASEDDVADLIRLDGSEAAVADFESETGDDNWPEGGAEAALLTLVARRDPAPEDTLEDGPAPEEDTAKAEEQADVAGEDATDDQGDDAVTWDDTTDDATDDVTIDDTHAEASDVAETSSDGEVDAPEDDDTGEVEVAAQVQAETEAEVNEVAEADAEDIADIEMDIETPVEDLGDTPSPFSFPEAEDGILDEDTLREIIVEVVREELQGVLGQRITRNVRKMVRREIRLALAAEDLE